MKAFKNLFFYKLARDTGPGMTNAAEAMAPLVFVPCGATQQISRGYVPPRGVKGGPLIELVGRHAFVTVCTETKSVPGSTLKRAVDEAGDVVERNTGRRPKGKALKEIKEMLLQDLLPRAFPRRANSMVWFDFDASRLVVAASSVARADEIVSMLTHTFDGLVVSYVTTEFSPAQIMSGWLMDRRTDFEEFAIGTACELKATDSTGEVVRYGRHDLDLDEIPEHLRQGKAATRLALTWRGRIRFTLTEAMQLRGVEFLDIVFENGEAEAGAEQFDADVAIATGELGRLIPELVAALGGEIVVGQEGEAQE